MEARGRLCKVCSLSPELMVQVNALLNQSKPLREISKLVSLAGKSVGFMSIARHKKHFSPSATLNEIVYRQMVEELDRGIQDLRKHAFKVYGNPEFKTMGRHGSS